YLAFTSSDQARYLVIRKNGRPSFVPETDLTTSAEPTTRQFVVLDKASYPENTQWHPPIQAHTNLYVLEIPFEGADKDFNNNGYLLPVYTITDTKDTLFAPLCAEAEIGDVITYYGSTLSDYGKWEPMWESMYREPDVKGNYAAEDTFTVTGSFFTDEQYADYLTEWHGERHFVFTSTEGSRYVVFTAAYEYPSFFPERYLNDFGDLNHDGIHNASDAAMILIQAALAGAQDATFLDPRIVEAKINGDLDGDGFSNASDAALLLIYAAELGAGTTRHPLQAYLYERDHTVMRVPVWLKDEYWGYDKASDNMQLITSPEELKTYFTKRIPMDINSISYMTSRDEEVVRAEIMAAYPEDFFETHHLVALGAAEGCTDTLQEIRSIEQNADGTVTILLHHSEICGEPLSGYFTVLVAVDKSITDVSEITVKESRSRILYTS
ncbi:MAG: dockerin type I repeat-containing protein, partial [Oscillospiraceae bacterium]|nr:dockerin type I repeat-containing protein [Oscillospiraceae bacterium]